MSRSDEGGGSSSSSITPTLTHQNQMKRYKGARRRKWGKWVSEIRVPGTQERLWLGSYVAPEAAAVAHDIAYYCLRRETSPADFNFPLESLALPSGVAERGMSPRSIQKVATDAGMALDAGIVMAKKTGHSPPLPSMQGINLPNPNPLPDVTGALELDISVEDYL